MAPVMEHNENSPTVEAHIYQGRIYGGKLGSCPGASIVKGPPQKKQ